MDQEQILQKNRKLLHGTLIYAAGNLGTKILSFLIVPLYTYYISTQQNGIYENLITASSLLIPLITLQMADAAYTRILSGKQDIRQCIACCYWILCAGILISSAMISLVNIFFPIPYCAAFIFYTAFQAVYFTFQKLLRALGRQKLYAGIGILYTAVFLSLNVFQIVILRLGVQSLLWSGTAASAICCLLLWVRMKPLRVFERKAVFSVEMKELLRFSVPLIPNQMNWWVMNSSDKFIITVFLGLAANGIYGITCRFPTILQMFLDFFNTSWMDLSVSEGDKQSALYNSGLFKSLYTFGFSLLVPLIPASQLFIEWVMAPAYKSAGLYVGFLYLGTLFQSFSSFFGVGYLKQGKTKGASTTSIYGAVANLAVNLLLIRWIGLQAAAVSTWTGFMIMWWIRYKQTGQSLQISLQPLPFVLWLAADLFVIVLCFWADLWIKMTVVLSGGLSFLYWNRQMIYRTFQILSDRSG